MSAKLELEITLDSKGAVSGVKSLDTAIGGLDKSTQGTTKSGKGFMDSMFAQVTAANLATKAISSMTNFVKDSIGEAIEAELVESKLNSTLRAHGLAVDIAGESIDRYASNMQAMTGATDEEIKSLATLAYNLGIHNEKIQDAVKGAVGLTTLYGGSMQGNLEAVASAFQGNWRQVDMLIPEVKNLTNESDKLALLQKKMAEGFIASTDAMKGQAGQLKAIKNQWNDFKEATGGALLTLFSGLQNVNNAFSLTGKLQKQLNEQAQAEQKIFDELKKTHLTYADIIADEAIKDKQATEILNRKSIEVKKSTDSFKEHIVIIKDLNQIMEERWAATNKQFEEEKAYAAFVESKLGPVIRSYSDDLIENYDITRLITNAEIEFDKQIEDLARDALNLGKTVDDGGKSFQELNAIFEITNSLFASFGDMLPGLGQGLAALVKGALDFGNALSTDANGITTLSGGITSFLTIGLGVAKALDEAFGNMWDNMAADLEDQQRRWKETSERIKQNFIQSWRAISDEAQNAFNIMTGAAYDPWETETTESIEKVKNEFLALWGDAAAAAQDAIDIMTGTMAASATPGETSSAAFNVATQTTPATGGVAGGTTTVVPKIVSGTRNTNISIEIKNPSVTPESVADALSTAFVNNTRGIKSLLES